MKHLPLIAVLTSIILTAALAQSASAQVQLRPGELLQTNGVALDVGDYAIPCVADWNGDGRKDLLVGYRYADKVAFYANQGSDANPVFSTAVNLQAGGAEIYVAGSGCGAPAPFVCDYDNDGKRDLLVGDGSFGYVYFFHNTNTDASPLLEPGVQLKAGGGTLSVSYRATPCVFDWDGDGLEDLLCGNGDGYIYFFKNSGTPQVPAYAAGVRLQAGGADLNLGIRAVPRVFDWDGDGVPDLVGSSNTGVYWCRNTGSRTSPVLAAMEALRAPLAGSGLQPVYTGARMRLDLVDWNNDGVLDLLVGNLNGTISCYEGYRFALTTIELPAVGQCALQWNSAPQLNYHVWAGPTVTSITNLVATSLPSGGKFTCWTNAVSEPQQFYRLQVAP